MTMPEMGCIGGRGGCSELTLFDNRFGEGKKRQYVCGEEERVILVFLWFKVV
jgi:hypothetical protein